MVLSQMRSWGRIRVPLVLQLKRGLALKLKQEKSLELKLLVLETVSGMSGRIEARSE